MAGSGWVAVPEGHGHSGEDEDDGGRKDGAAGAFGEGLLAASQIVGLGMARHLVGLTSSAMVALLRSVCRCTRRWRPQ